MPANDTKHAATPTMLAYHNDPAVKANILAQLEAHRAADELIHGTYWQDGKGCAVGCTVHSGDHAQYEPRFGIPQALARLEDVIFEGLPNGDAQQWPVRFMSAIQPGADLSRVQWRFLHWLLTDQQVNPGITHPLVEAAVRDCAALMLILADGGKVDPCAARSAESATWSAARSATWSAAWSAAWSAWSAESAAWSAESANRSAAWSAAWSAARSAAESANRSANRSAAWSAAWSAASAASAAWSAAWRPMADKLVALVAECDPVQETTGGRS